MSRPRRLVPAVTRRSPVAGSRRARIRPRRVRTDKPWDWMMVTAVLTALGVVGATVFAGLSFTATREQIAVAQQQADVAEQGQYTERFTRAVAQLDQAGPEHLQSRLGGIYALERLARDSPRDQPTVIEVLSAFIRTTSPTQPTPAPDVQAALTALSRRDTTHDNHTTIDLTRANLTGVNLTNAKLAGANLTGAKLTNAILYVADLSDARLYGADLTRAVLNGANLARATLPRADLTHVYLTDANLTHANLTEAILRDAALPGANLTSAALTSANLTNASLLLANLTDATLYGATLSGADLNSANLTGADLTKADLTQANLTGAIRERTVGLPGQ
ncbi:pentapeptide repeat-containing protein [Actinokineospora sp. HUAS TT18]|uniref:pentapeptide repeat-containing protein n=1 Tax=Actinokineospora sp. HUAS TT18 TaxID=3447451 RepID=UPI003F52155D